MKKLSKKVERRLKANGGRYSTRLKNKSGLSTAKFKRACRKIKQDQDDDD